MAPFAYVSQVHYSPFTDLSWSPDGRIAMATSSEGFLTFVLFGEEELGVQYKGAFMEFKEPQAVVENYEKMSAKKRKLFNEKKAVESSMKITNFFKKRTI